MRNAIRCAGVFAGFIHFSVTALAQNAPAYVDPQMKATLSEISAGEIQSNIEKLVSFQTRSKTATYDVRRLCLWRRPTINDAFAEC
jgi:hypothetical protein